MADHLRKQLREAVKALLDSELGTNLGPVKAYRVFPIEPRECPLVAVHCQSDEVIRASPTGDEPDYSEDLERVVDLRITAFAAAPEDALEDQLDEASKLIEQALAQGISMGAITLRADYQGEVSEYQAGDQPYGSVQMRWSVEMIHNSASPDVLIA